MQDWSLDPRIRAILSKLPLPFSLPTELRRTPSRAEGGELAGMRALLTGLGDDLDRALLSTVRQAGAEVGVAAAIPWSSLPVGVRHESWPDDTAESLIQIVRDGGETPVLLVHRLGVDSGDPARNSQTDRLFAAAQAASHLPANSRFVIVAGSDLSSDSSELLIALASGTVRTAFKEFGRIGTTAHLVRAQSADVGAVAELVAYLGGPHAAFVTGLDLRASGGQGEISSGNRTLNGKHALVTGGARGIGAAIALRLAQEGAAIWINDLSSAAAPAEAVIQAIVAAGGRAQFIGADLGTEAGITEIAASIKGSAGKLDVVVHNAGITRDKTLRKMSLQNWRQVLQIDLGALVRLQAALDPLMANNSSLIAMSSVMGIAGNFGQANYTAAKAAVLELTRQWARQGAVRGTRANAIAPGFILTEMTAQIPLFNREMAKQLTALAQPGTPDDVAELACFLASPRSRALNGAALRCDGGMALGA